MSSRSKKGLEKETCRPGKRKIDVEYIADSITDEIWIPIGRYRSISSIEIK